MRRYKRARDFENSDRWLISYADFITLLFAFFVVMYSISQVNQGKYRVLSESLVAAFNITERSMTPIQQGNINRRSTPDIGESNALPGNDLVGENQDTGKIQATQNQLAQLNATARQSKKQFALLETNLKDGLKDVIDRGLVKIKATDEWIEISLPDNLLFASGSDRLGDSAEKLLQEVMSLFLKKENTNLIRIRGFTDNIPVTVGRFRSNWALSAARAVAVARLLQDFGIDPTRMATEGYGSHAPIADNSTPRGRKANRRVVIAISRYIHGVETPTPFSTDNMENTKTDNLEFEEVRQQDGSLIIRGKDLPKEKPEGP